MNLFFVWSLLGRMSKTLKYLFLESPAGLLGLRRDLYQVGLALIVVCSHFSFPFRWRGSAQRLSIFPTKIFFKVFMFSSRLSKKYWWYFFRAHLVFVSVYSTKQKHAQIAKNSYSYIVPRDIIHKTQPHIPTHTPRTWTVKMSKLRLRRRDFWGVTTMS